jgi:hypothetical protein
MSKNTGLPLKLARQYDSSGILIDKDTPDMTFEELKAWDAQRREANRIAGEIEQMVCLSVKPS